jgi:hypothetical protein
MAIASEAGASGRVPTVERLDEGAYQDPGDFRCLLCDWRGVRRFTAAKHFKAKHPDEACVVKVPRKRPLVPKEEQLAKRRVREKGYRENKKAAAKGSVWTLYFL